jgi:hypothetical protein
MPLKEIGSWKVDYLQVLDENGNLDPARFVIEMIRELSDPGLLLLET